MLQMLGTFLIKASSYKMVQENSRHGADSYWYSIDHTSRKSLCHILNGWQTEKKPFGAEPGVCHADELMYLFKLQLPLILCDAATTMGNFITTFVECARSIDELDLGECIADPERRFIKETGECLDGRLSPEEEVRAEKIAQIWTSFAGTG